MRIGRIEITVPLLIKWTWPLAGGAMFIVAYLLFTGPQMASQPNVRTYRAEMPLPPAGAVPVAPVTAALPSVEEARGLSNPLEASATNIGHARVYYGYYCVFCHGPRGDGTGPVGPHYVPAPADLASPRIQAMPDGQLLLACLTGQGHSPVLEYVVPAEFRWYLVLYVRQFQGRPPGPTPANPG